MVACQIEFRLLRAAQTEINHVNEEGGASVSLSPVSSDTQVMYSCAMTKQALTSDMMYCTTGLIPTSNVFTWEFKDTLESYGDISEVNLPTFSKAHKLLTQAFLI